MGRGKRGRVAAIQEIDTSPDCARQWWWWRRGRFGNYKGKIYMSVDYYI